MRNIVVVLVSFTLSALVAGFCVSAIRTSNQAEARQETRQEAVPPDAVPPRPNGPWRTVPAYELDDVWPF
jgi:hypothetical protein